MERVYIPKGAYLAAYLDRVEGGALRLPLILTPTYTLPLVPEDLQSLWRVRCRSAKQGQCLLRGGPGPTDPKVQLIKKPE